MAEIKRAYRRRALKEHPDVNKAPDAKERWQELSSAYEILSDPQKQKLWEEAKRQGTRRQGQARSWGSAPKGPRQAAEDARYDAGGDTFGSIFNDLLEGLGREVGGVGTGPVGRARKVGGYVLEELLDFLEGTRGKASGRAAGGDQTAAWDDDNPADQLRFAREELSTLESLDKTLREEAATWESKAQAAKSSGNREAELDAMQKVFDARDRRKSVRRRLIRAEENVEYLEKVVFEVERKRQARGAPSQGAQSSQGAQVEMPTPGMYTVVHDKTAVVATVELSQQSVGVLSKGATIQVLEVVDRPQDKRIRGRIQRPAGWISLVNTETGKRWAEKIGSSSQSRKGPDTSGSSSYSGSSYGRSSKPAFDADAALQELKRSKSGR